ncbi:hypothetical protein ACFE04_011187 [Oxalis oulophora]
MAPPQQQGKTYLFYGHRNRNPSQHHPTVRGGPPINRRHKPQTPQNINLSTFISGSHISSTKNPSSRPHKNGHMDLALNVYRDFNIDGLKEESVTYMILIKAGRIDEMMDVLVKIGKLKYSFTVVHVCKSGDSENIIKVNEMMHEGCHPDQVIYCAIIHGCCKHRKLEVAKRVLSSLRGRKLLIEADMIVYEEMLIDHMKKQTTDLVLAGLSFFHLESNKTRFGKSTSLGFDMQSVGKDLAYTLRSKTMFGNFWNNKATSGLSVTFLSQIPVGRTTNLIAPANMNNRGAGQISVRMDNSKKSGYMSWQLCYDQKIARETGGR